MKKVLTVGGGTGSYAVLSGLKNIPDIDISAIVSMADDGGTNGMLRKEYNVLPPSDARQCLVALSSEESLSKLINYRFPSGTLSGYSFGSILISTLEKVTGDFEKALETASKILKIKGKVIPSTLDNAELKILLKDGKEITGESKINAMNFKVNDVEKVFYKNNVTLSPVAKNAILNADYIIVCPGDFYTSIVPNLIVDGWKEALTQSKAKIIAIENLQNTEQNEYKNELEFYLGKSIDHLVPSNNSLISQEPIIKNIADTVERSSIRHDSKKLAKIIENIINK